VADLGLHPHQEKAVKELSNGKILFGGVGSGKSITAVAYYLTNEAPRDVYVITTAKKRDSLDWEAEFIKAGVSTHPGGLAGRLTVDSWNNITKYTDIREAFFIFDEQRLVGSGVWTKVFITIAKANHWILLSGTPGDTWLDYIPVFVANGWYKNRTDFKRQHVVYSHYSKFPKVDHYVDTGRLLRLRREVLVHMPYTRHTNRLETIIDVSYDKEQEEMIWKKRWNVYDDKPLKDVAELCRVARKSVNSDASRITALKELMEKHPRVIVFYNFDYELEILREGLSESNSILIQKPSTTKNDSESKIESIPSMNSPELFTKTKLAQAALDNQTSAQDLQKAVSNYLDATSESAGSVDSRSGMENTDTTWTTSSGRHMYLLTNQMIDRYSYLSAEQLQREILREIGQAQIDSNGTPDQCSWTDEESGLTSVESCGSSDIRDSVQIAEWNGHKHEEIPQSARWVYLVQYTAGAEGWNCTETDTIVFYSLNYSYKLNEQCKGRIDRMNTKFTDLHYYYLKSKSKIDNMIWKSISHKQDFQPKMAFL
jgi:hypothetical protein